MIRKTLWIAVAAALAGSLPAYAQVAKVNGVTIPQARADMLMRISIAQGRQDDAELREAVKQRLIENELLSQEAVRTGINKRSDVNAQLEISRQDVLRSALLNEIASKFKPTDSDLKGAYEAFKEHPAASEYKPRHILVKSEDEAKAVLAQLKEGGDFEKLAAEKSVDTGSGKQGGDLGWNTPSRFVPQFANAMVRLKKGDITDAPVQTNFGWHIIQMTDKRGLSFDVLKPQLSQLLQRDAVQKNINALRAKAKIE